MHVQEYLAWGAPARGRPIRQLWDPDMNVT
jgi:hypothetical protein